MATTAVVTRVPALTTPQTLAPANDYRLQVVIMNDSTADLYVKLGDNASPTDFTYKLTAGQTMELPHLVMPFQNVTSRVEGCYGGLVTGVWTAAAGAAQVTELQ